MRLSVKLHFPLVPFSRAVGALLLLAGSALAQSGPKCATTTVIDTSTFPATASYDCSANGCSTGCFSFQEMTPYGMGTTCSCSSVLPPRCCHLILVPNGSQWIVVASGNCGTASGCQSGDACGILTLIDEDRFTSTAKCAGDA